MNPIVIVGCGLAGIAAASELRRLQRPFLLVDEEASVGGRCATIRGEGWLADPAVSWISSTDPTVLELIRTVGLDTELVSLQGPVRRLRGGKVLPFPGGMYRNLRGGFGTLLDKWVGDGPRPLLGTFVAAIRWIEGRRLFLFRDGRTGATLSHPISRARIEASGVVLAVPPRRAAALAAQSRVLLPAAETLAALPAQPAAAAIFVLPRVEIPWSALVIGENNVMTLLVCEEAKAPGNVDADKTVLVARTTPEMANARYAKDCLLIVYEAIREILPALPEQPLEAHVIGWEEGIGTEPFVGLETDPPGVPVAVAVESGTGSTHERLARAGVQAAREVVARLG